MSRRVSAMRPTNRVALATAIRRTTTSETMGGATISTLGSQITTTSAGDEKSQRAEFGAAIDIET